MKLHQTFILEHHAYVIPKIAVNNTRPNPQLVLHCIPRAIMYLAIGSHRQLKRQIKSRHKVPCGTKEGWHKVPCGIKRGGMICLVVLKGKVLCNPPPLPPYSFPVCPQYI